MTVTPLKNIDDSHIISKRHFLTNIKLEDKQGSKDSMIDIVSNRMAFKLENRLSEIRQNGTQRYSSSRTIQRALLTPKYHPANTTYHSRKMFCINKIEIQGSTKELQTPYFWHNSAAADSSGEIDLLAKATPLLHDLNLLFLL